MLPAGPGDSVRWRDVNKVRLRARLPFPRRQQEGHSWRRSVTEAVIVVCFCWMLFLCLVCSQSGGQGRLVVDPPRGRCG